MMKIICAWCQKNIGEKPGEGTTHGICPECKTGLLEKAALRQEGRLP